MSSLDEVFFSSKTKRSPVKERDTQVRLHIFTGLFVILGIGAVIFFALYVTVLRKSPVALWLTVAGIAVFLLFLAWKFFRDNGALLTGRLFSG